MENTIIRTNIGVSEIIQEWARSQGYYQGSFWYHWHPPNAASMKPGEWTLLGTNQIKQLFGEYLRKL